MKTTKLILIAAILAIASLGFAQPESSPALSEATPDLPQLAVKIHFRMALQNRALVRAMHLQLDPRFLINDQPTYTVVVKLNNTVYYIIGTYDEWKRFFWDINEQP